MQDVNPMTLNDARRIAQHLGNLIEVCGITSTAMSVLEDHTNLPDLHGRMDRSPVRGRKDSQRLHRLQKGAKAASNYLDQLSRFAKTVGESAYDISAATKTVDAEMARQRVEAALSVLESLTKAGPFGWGVWEDKDKTEQATVTLRKSHDDLKNILGGYQASGSIMQSLVDTHFKQHPLLGEAHAYYKSVIAKRDVLKSAHSFLSSTKAQQAEDMRSLYSAFDAAFKSADDFYRQDFLPARQEGIAFGSGFAAKDKYRRAAAETDRLTDTAMGSLRRTLNAIESHVKDELVMTEIKGLMKRIDSSEVSGE